MFRLFSKKRISEDLVLVYTTKDSWEAELVRSALLSDDIMVDLKTTKGDRKNRQNVIYVPASRVSEAQMVINRTSEVLSRKDEIIAEQERLASEKQTEFQDDEEPEKPEIAPAGESVLIAEKDGVGKIFYYEEDDAYELRLEMEFYKLSHFMSGEEWEEFIDFSAQRQEFFILLKEKYPKLSALVKEHKMRPQLLKLLEYSYGKTPPPRRRMED
jgi:hypothetical protein